MVRGYALPPRRWCIPESSAYRIPYVNNDAWLLDSSSNHFYFAVSYVLTRASHKSASMHD